MCKNTYSQKFYEPFPESTVFNSSYIFVSNKHLKLGHILLYACQKSKFQNLNSCSTSQAHTEVILNLI